MGVLIYEMLIGVTPFFNRNKQMLFTKIKSSKVVFPDRTKYKIDYSDELMDLVNGLLDKNQATRLGTVGDVDEILAHPFFASIDMKALEAGKLTPPFIPKVDEKDFTKFFNADQDKSAIADTYIPRVQQKNVKAHQDAFSGFSSNKNTLKK